MEGVSGVLAGDRAEEGRAAQERQLCLTSTARTVNPPAAMATGRATTATGTTTTTAAVAAMVAKANTEVEATGILASSFFTLKIFTL